MFGRSRHAGDSHAAPRRTMGQRLFFIIPLVLSLAAFILALITLLAGYKPGFLPETHIVLLDTSRLGRDLLPSRSSLSLVAERQLGDMVDEAKDKLKDKADDVIGDIVDGVTGALGIDRWYALHAMTVCSGAYANGNDSSGGLNARRCTRPLQELNILDVIDLDLQVPGPIRAALDDLDQDAPKVFQAMGGLYIAGAALTGLGLLGALATALLPRKGRLLSALNFAVLLLAGVALLAASLLTTIGGDKIAELIANETGRIGLRAEVGAKFRALSWAAFALTALAGLAWLVAFFRVYRRSSRRGGHGSWDKDYAGSSTRGASYEMGGRSRI